MMFMFCHRRLFILDRMKVVAFLVFVVFFNVAASTRNLKISTKGPLCGKGDAWLCSCQCRPKEKLDCDESFYLVSGPWRVPDEQITASSEWTNDVGYYHGPERSRLHTQLSYTDVGYDAGAWSAGTNSLDQYIQVELLSNGIVMGIQTQGRNSFRQYVTKYRVLYSMDGIFWQNVTDISGNVKEFSGNYDSDTVVTNMVPQPFVAKYVRINALAWFDHISLRFDLLGCLA